MLFPVRILFPNLPWYLCMIQESTGLPGLGQGEVQGSSSFPYFLGRGEPLRYLWASWNLVWSLGEVYCLFTSSSKGIFVEHCLPTKLFSPSFAPQMNSKHSYTAFLILLFSKSAPSWASTIHTFLSMCVVNVFPLPESYSRASLFTPLLRLPGSIFPTLWPWSCFWTLFISSVSALLNL